MKTLAVMSPMAGTGKTYTAFALSRGLAQRGYKVLAVDADWQSCFTILSGKEPRDVDGFWRSFVEGEVDPSTVQTVQEAGFSLIFCDPSLLRKSKGDLIDKKELKEALSLLANQYDYCVIDAAPDFRGWSTSIMLAADQLILPVAGRMMGMYYLERFIEKVAYVQAGGNPDLTVAGVLAVMQTDAGEQRQLVTWVAEQVSTIVFETAIRYDEVFVGAARRRGQNVFLHCAESTVPADYEKFVEEYLSDECVK